MIFAIMNSSQADLATDTRKKIAWRLLPFLFLLYIVN